MTMNETSSRDRIRHKADELFMRYGIRSVSMDDIASQLGMSKKTIYQFFSDKDDLVDAVVDSHLVLMETDCVRCKQDAADAVEEIVLTLDYLVDMCNSINPMVLYDLEKFHFRAFQKFQEHKSKFLYRTIQENIEWGIRDGLYRSEINVDILAKFRLETMLMAFNVDLFPPSKYNFSDVCGAILEHFLYGLVSRKGYDLTLQYQHNRTNKSIQDAKIK
ncbi:MAG: TetR/AcrR family transcriptional regulator [Chitinophagaceae bacterium]